MNLLVTIFLQDRTTPTYFIKGATQILQGIATAMRECNAPDTEIIAVSCTCGGDYLPPKESKRRNIKVITL